MKKALVLAGVMLAFGAAQVSAQLFYDPYYNLIENGKTGAAAVGINNTDLAGIGDATDVMAMGRFAFSGQIEMGALVSLGMLQQGADSFQKLLVGGKFGMTKRSAATFNVLVPVGAVNDPGIAVGYMRTFESGSWIDLDTHAQLALLKGYAPQGSVVDLLAELTGPLGASEKVTGHIGFLTSSNTDNIGDNLAINCWPNVDIKLGKAMINIGASIGLAGKKNQNDLGMKAFLIMAM